MYQDRLHTYSERKGYKRTVRHTRESQALRDIRIYKKTTREEVAKLIGKSKETIKKCEDGRSNYALEDQGVLLRHFRFTKADFQEVLNGQRNIPKLHARGAYKTTRKATKECRKYQKIISKESRVLTILRKRAKLSQPEAAKLCGFSRSMIDHRESGRVDLSDKIEEIKRIVSSYGQKMENYYDLLNSEILRDEVIEDCLKILETISDDKLKAVQALLVNFK
jgi:DNA-binding XRE family transcriptional regulator